MCKDLNGLPFRLLLTDGSEAIMQYYDDHLHCYPAGISGRGTDQEAPTPDDTLPKPIRWFRL